jgi:hypothetical protein
MIPKEKELGERREVACQIFGRIRKSRSWALVSSSLFADHDVDLVSEKSMLAILSTGKKIYSDALDMIAFT